jgi:hypothetical protein
MLRRGFRLLLEPDKYEVHAVTAAKLRRSRAWLERDPQSRKPAASDDAPESEKPDVLPHQLKMIEEIRKNNRLE